MMRQLVVMAILALLVCPSAVLRAEGDGDEAKRDQETRKIDKFLGIDWGKDKKDADADKDDPDARQPGQKADLAQALEKVQLTRLDRVKRDAAQADKMKEVADKIYAGRDKRVKKPVSIRRYEIAGGKYRKAAQDVVRLAKQVKDEDTRLTLLREFKDAYVEQACEMFCKSAAVVVELAKKPGDLKAVAKPLVAARKMNRKYHGIVQVVTDARAKLLEMQEKIRVAKNQGSGGGEKDKDDRYDDSRPDRNYGDRGREDYKERDR